jgi:hypothetical protein
MELSLVFTAGLAFFINNLFNTISYAALHKTHSTVSKDAGTKLRTVAG